ncbi:UNVERIFIED_CONTAM: 3-oxoacyl-[acyl-carrier-protein] synthase [Siphonaria sp. JEL0065]|nr:3-oxoacyl-[acyl-carrier-protein] synthase [Siphonaria sp. JEL0065]
MISKQPPDETRDSEHGTMNASRGLASFAMRGSSLADLALHYNNTDTVSIPIPTSLLQVAESVLQRLVLNGDGLEQESKILVHSKFLSLSLQESLPLAAAVFNNFQALYTSDNDIHTVVRDFPLSQKTFVLKTYYVSVAALDVKLSPSSSLLRAAEFEQVTLGVAFGGQGMGRDYFIDLFSLVDVYGPLVLPLVKKLTSTLFEYSTCPERMRLNGHTINVLEWLENPETRPNAQTMLDTDISMPLIAMTQILHYWVMLRIAGKTPGEMRRLIKGNGDFLTTTASRSYKLGTTGHSQGIISSVVIASSETDDEFIENARKAVGLLYWIGLHSRSVWEVSASPVNERTLQDCLNNDEGVPTPMLAVSGACGSGTSGKNKLPDK